MLRVLREQVKLYISTKLFMNVSNKLRETYFTRISILCSKEITSVKNCRNKYRKAHLSSANASAIGGCRGKFLRLNSNPHS